MLSIGLVQIFVYDMIPAALGVRAARQQRIERAEIAARAAIPPMVWMGR